MRAKGQKVYISKDTNEVMIYDHDFNCACWGKGFYRLDFNAVKQYWVYIGEF